MCFFAGGDIVYVYQTGRQFVPNLHGVVSATHTQAKKGNQPSYGTESICNQVCNSELNYYKFTNRF